MSAATIGGLLLIIGAWFTYRGNILLSIIIYFCADFCWLVIAVSTGDYLGSSLVLIGMALGIGIFIKMHKGIFVKTLLRVQEPRNTE